MRYKKSCVILVVIIIALLWGFAPAYGDTEINEVCPQRITLDIDGHTMKIPYCRNSPLGSANTAIKRALIVIHGTNRTADDYYNSILSAAMQADGAESETIIIAPQFLIESDIVDFDLGDEILFWTNSGWKRGDESESTSQHPRPVHISSFSAIDIILQRLSDRNNFPNLRQIVIAGHSAGGQFTNRFAAGSQMQQVLTQQYGIQFRYIVANPSSYLYFNEERRIEGTVDQFAIPDSTGCSYYNEYKYGLEDLNSYMSGTGVAQIRGQYPAREVAYLLGSEDIDPNSPDLDKSCAAMLQGSHRLERGTIYHNYIIHYFGTNVINRHTKVIVNGVAHSAYGIFNSACGVRYLFDYDPNGECGSPLQPDLSLSIKNANVTNVKPGQIVTYTLTLLNTGVPDATKVFVADTLPVSLTYQSGTLIADGGSYNYSSGIITWTGYLSAGEAILIHYSAMVSPELSVSDTQVLRNIALINDSINAPFQRTAAVFINPFEIFLPLVWVPPTSVR